MVSNPFLGSSKGAFGGSRRSKRSVVATLMLTSLVDTFSVLVIYLLVSFNTAEELLYINKDMQLPAAVKTETLERNVVVKVEKDKLYVEDDEVGVKGLVKRLLKVRKNWEKYYPGTEFSGALTIQADKRQAYDLLSHVIQAGGHAGYSDINFAVVRK